MKLNNNSNNKLEHTSYPGDTWLLYVLEEIWSNQQLRQKTYFHIWKPSEESDQPGHSHSLIRIFTGRILDSQGCKSSSCGKMKTLIRLRECAGWFESSLGAHARQYIFSRCGLMFSDPVWVLIISYDKQYLFKALQLFGNLVKVITFEFDLQIIMSF